MSFSNKKDTTWSAPQVCPRPVESGLGGHEEGVLAVDDGVEDASLPLRKRGRTTKSVCATFSDFIGVENQNDSENQNTRRYVVDNDTLLVTPHPFLFIRAEQQKNEGELFKRFEVCLTDASPLENKNGAMIVFVNGPVMYCSIRSSSHCRFDSQHR